MKIMWPQWLKVICGEISMAWVKAIMCHQCGAGWQRMKAAAAQRWQRRSVIIIWLNNVSMASAYLAMPESRNENNQWRENGGSIMA
jgi:hypothetical protein